MLEMSRSTWLALPRMGNLLESDFMEAMNRLEDLRGHSKSLGVERIQET